METEDKEGRLVNEILNIAKSKDYQYRLLLNEDPLKVDILFEQNPSGHFIHQHFNRQTIITSIVPHTNIPLFRDISLLLKKEIRTILQQSLPEYMVPSDLIALNHLPLTNNGKVDRKFLSQREDVMISDKLNYQAPHNDTEKILTKIWQELLGVDRVGIHDNFFELGGHSLLAMRVISSVRKELGIELAIKDLFMHPTISGFAMILDTQNGSYYCLPLK